MIQLEFCKNAREKFIAGGCVVCEGEKFYFMPYGWDHTIESSKIVDIRRALMVKEFTVDPERYELAYSTMCWAPGSEWVETNEEQIMKLVELLNYLHGEKNFQDFKRTYLGFLMFHFGLLEFGCSERELRDIPEILAVS
jgi:hypothetical protein